MHMAMHLLEDLASWDACQSRSTNQALDQRQSHDKNLTYRCVVNRLTWCPGPVATWWILDDSMTISVISDEEIQRRHRVFPVTISSGHRWAPSPIHHSRSFAICFFSLRDA